MKEEIKYCGSCAMFENEDISGTGWCDAIHHEISCDAAACESWIGHGSDQ